jgi:hypothetical protein
LYQRHVEGCQASVPDPYSLTTVNRDSPLCPQPPRSYPKTIRPPDGAGRPAPRAFGGKGPGCGLLGRAIAKLGELGPPAAAGASTSPGDGCLAQCRVVKPAAPRIRQEGTRTGPGTPGFGKGLKNSVCCRCRISAWLEMQNVPNPDPTEDRFFFPLSDIRLCQI